MKLADIGLTTYESKVYEALLANGTLTAPAAANLSGVPYGRIYPTLASLCKKGFAQMYSGRPQRFSAVPPAACIPVALDEKEACLAHMRKSSEQLVKELVAAQSFVAPKAQETVKIIEGYKNYLNLSISLHNAAKKEWLSVSELSTFKPHIDAYRECLSKGVAVRILTSKAEITAEKIAVWKELGAQIRMTDFLATKFSVIDGNDVTIRLASGDRYLSLWIQNPSLAQSLRNYFLQLWRQAKSI